MAEVFISYASEKREYARRIASLLEANGFSTWSALDLVVGDTYRNVLETHLDGASAVIVLWDKRSVTADFVKSEANRGHADGKLLQVFLEEVDVPLGFDEVQGLSLNLWNGSVSDPRLRELVGAVERLVGRDAAPYAKVLGLLTELTPLPQTDSTQAPASSMAVDDVYVGTGNGLKIEGEAEVLPTRAHFSCSSPVVGRRYFLPVAISLVLLLILSDLTQYDASLTYALDEQVRLSTYRSAAGPERVAIPQPTTGGHVLLEIHLPGAYPKTAPQGSHVAVRMTSENTQRLVFAQSTQLVGDYALIAVDAKRFTPGLYEVAVEVPRKEGTLRFPIRVLAAGEQGGR